jgi:hypothetical protein
MFDQRLSTIPQHQWITKLFGYDFTVEYRHGRLNTVADALSRRDSEKISLHTISTPTFQLYDDIRNAINVDTELSALRNNIIAGFKEPTWSVTDGLILKSGKVYIPSTSDLLQQILQLSHTSAHEGQQKTLQRLLLAIILTIAIASSGCSKLQHGALHLLHMLISSSS